MCHCCWVSTYEVCYSNQSDPHNCVGHNCFLKMENICLLQLFDGQNCSLGTNTRCSRLFKLLHDRTSWRGCRKSFCVKSNVHHFARETCTLAPSRSSNSMSVLQRPQSSLCPKYLPSSPKNALTRHGDGQSREQRRYLPYGHWREIADEEFKSSDTKQEK